MQIGVVAKKVGLTVDAVRFYESNALLPRPPRSEGGFRQYGESDVETLAFVRRVKRLGFTLSEIRGLLKLRGIDCSPALRHAANCSESSLMYGRNWQTFRGWSTNSVWRCEVVTESFVSAMRIVPSWQGLTAIPWEVQK